MIENDMPKGEEEILKYVNDNKVYFINLQFSDIMGRPKNVTIPYHRLEDSFSKGTWFDGSSIEGFTRIHESDQYLKPDPNTFAVIPWFDGDLKSCRLICDVYTPDGKPFKGDPRYILKETISRANRMGYEPKAAPELEFFLFSKKNMHIEPLPHDRGNYFDLVMDLAYDVRKDMMISLEKMLMKVEASHHEVGPGQHEIDFSYDGTLTTADNAMTFKYTLKAIGAKHNLHVSFMPKPLEGQNGSGMHVHQSLFRDGKNAFYSADDRYGLSEAAYHFINGQLEHINELVAITNPTVNSYKRLVPGYEAATYVTWARINRSALIRIPQSKGESGARAEIRCPDPSANPYLAFAALLAAGLSGIEEGKMPPAPVEEDVFEYSDEMLKEKGIGTLPHSLWQALKYMRRSELAKGLLGEHTFERYLEGKTKEWDSYRTAVTDWEMKHYLETV